MASKKRISMLSRLRRAIANVKFLLSFDATRWIVSSLKRSSSPAAELSFHTRPSLLDCSDDYYDSRSSFALSWTSSSLMSSPDPATQMTRSASDASSSSSPDGGSGEDINLRADRFIEGFYRQLRMERQVSLELRYLRGDSGKSLERTASD
ncbi:uncharacterized protein LOC122031562 [Zingiber officinale]|uniref:Uncharacterized protein n=1 Tax=Zingiber officinale TaxID=94328 RepID=A0A8J5EUP3_ZINOF|nr:uncharacterized protein LOC122031562 [Zingiber officinale]KAG6470939.1 hypothetical protein ZIOFF_072027 [Zingiber officinale]